MNDLLVRFRNSWARVFVAGVILGGGSVLGQTGSGMVAGSVRRVVERAGPWVVTIRLLDMAEPPLLVLPPGVPEPVRSLVPRRLRRGVIPGGMERLATVSGLVVNAGKLGVVTCDHLIGETSRVAVVLADGRELISSEIRRDPRSDLALILVEWAGEKPAAAEFADRSPELGEWQVALGRPLREPLVLSAGLASGMREDPQQVFLGPLATADVRVSPSSRGGALVDLAGKVTGLLTDLGHSELDGLGRAIPVETLRRVVEDLAQLGYVRRAYLGIQMSQQFEPETSRGRVLVQSVVENAPAWRAGMRPGDEILEFGGKRVEFTWGLRSLIETAVVGQPIEVKVKRGEERLDLRVTPEEMGREEVTGRREREGRRGVRPAPPRPVDRPAEPPTTLEPLEPADRPTPRS